MVVLVLAVASFLVFVVILMLLAIADTLESRAGRKKTNLAAPQPPLLSITEAFDPIYSVLWEAPIAALQLINSAGTSGIPAARLRPIYENVAARFPEIYEGCTFALWLQFLEKTQLISWQACNVVLTSDGHAFLKFRFVTDATVKI